MMTTVADQTGGFSPTAASSGDHIEQVEHYSAHNYHPLPITT